MAWQEKYRNKLVTAQEAAGLVKSGDRILMPPMGDPPALTRALAARKSELRDVEITLGGLPNHNAGWYTPGSEEAFPLNVFYIGTTARPMIDAHRADFTPFVYSMVNKPGRDERPERKRWDWFYEIFSPPDDKGFCSYGNQMWWRKALRSSCKKVVGEIDSNQIRTFGDNSIHISEIDYLVEDATPRLAPPAPLEIGEHSRVIAGHVSSLIRDGDTIQIGFGTATDPLAMLGTFDNKHDLGVHTELTTYGIIDLVKRGVINGKRKTIHPDKVVSTCFWPEPGALDYIDNNPMFELYDVSYTNDPRVVSKLDNMVSINSGLAIDLTGQIAAESLGPRMWSGTGGAMDFALGSLYSKGGRYILCLTSTTLVKGQMKSRIVPQLLVGTYLTVPRSLADHVVTEYGIARLLNKSQRERANELIAIAHPDFRSELREAAKRLFYP